MLDNKIRTDVFISSTSKDLEAYRKVVTEAILLRGFHPIGMENWAVSGDNPVDLCKREVGKADVFIGIYAYRYGWQPDGFGGKSITELEYDWAIERGIPCFCFIVDDSFGWAENAREPEKLNELNAFKARLKSTYIGFFTTPDNLKAQVIGALAQVPDPISAPDLTEYCRVVYQQSKKSNLLMALTESDDVRKRAIGVDEIYTPLHLVRQVERTSAGNPILTSLPHDEITTPQKDKKRTPLTAMEATNAYQRLVILGDPGSGKTIFVNYLALCMTGCFITTDSGWHKQLKTQGWTHDEFLPISITLRDFASGLTDSSFKTVLDHIAYLCNKEGFQHAVLDGIRQYLQAGQALVLFDGLDEVPPDKREIVRDALHAFMERYPHNRYVVTCRILSYTQPQWQLHDMDAVETVAPLNKDQIAHFVNAWYTIRANAHSISQTEATQRIKELTAQIKDDDLLEMASNPMLLTVMTFVHNSKGTLPKEKARLYDQCVEWLLLRWKGEEVKTLFKLLDLRSETDLSKILWEIAYNAHLQHADNNGVGDITEGRILTIVKKHVNNDWGLAQRFCDYVQFRAGLLIGRGTNADGEAVFTFPHRTFQEFLAGQYLLTDDFQEHAPKIARKGAGWREVMLLATGHLVYKQANDVEVAKAVEAILYDDPTTPNDWGAVWLAGEMLAITRPDRLTASERGKRALKRTQTLLVQLIEGGHLPPVERAGAGRILSQLGDPRQGVGTITVSGITLPDVVWCQIKTPSTSPASDFYISKYPITYSQYELFVQDNGYLIPHYWSDAGLIWVKDKQHPITGWFNTNWHLSNHPVIGITWYEASAFCNWLTEKLNLVISLPTEQQWEYAANGNAQSSYPWGNQYFESYANVTEHEKNLFNNKNISRTVAVGLYPQNKSVWGVMDLIGNVTEWCLNEFHEPSNIQLEGTASRVMKGGSWDQTQENAKIDKRIREYPFKSNAFTGFRIVCNSIK